MNFLKLNDYLQVNVATTRHNALNLRLREHKWMTGGPRAWSPAFSSKARAAEFLTSSCGRLQQMQLGASQRSCSVSATSRSIFIAAADTPLKHKQINQLET